MYPLGHLALAYLAYSGGVRLLEGRGPTDGPVVALVVGSQFPDLVDKPLAWGLGVLPASRTLAHSIYVAVAVIWVVGFVGTRLGRGAEGMAFGFGYASHLLSDAAYPLMNDGVVDPSFLAWPLTAPITYVGNWQLVPYLRAMLFDPTLGFELVFAAIVFGVWLRDGKPGLGVLRQARSRWRTRLSRG